jgi:hypothetical protein
MPPIVIALLLGVAAFGVYQYAFGGGFGPSSGSFKIQGGSKFWANDLAPALKVKLSSLKASPIDGAPDTWALAATGAESALARVQLIQGSGAFAVTTDNLLSAQGPYGLSKVPASGVATLAPEKGTVAVLPAIV